jgi:hypothetical protein
MQDPRKYFKYSGCASCFDKPCDRLRFGGVFPGKFIFVPGASLTDGLFDCPFIARDADEIEQLLDQVSSEELADRLDHTLELCTPDELLLVHQHDAMNCSSALQRTAPLIRELWENRIVGILRIPRLFLANKTMRQWLFAYEGLDYLLKKPELEAQSKAAAVTDGLADAKKGDLNNPRWEHRDADRAKASPDVAAIGDTVLLMASAPGFADGAAVAFDIFDASGGSPEKIETATGSVDGGRAEAKWIVSDPNDAGDKLDLQFEASADDKRTEKASIPTKFIFDILLQIDVDDPKAQDDVLILLDENNAEVKKLPVKDMKEISEDIVRIVIEDIDMDKKYTMIRDYGAEDDGGHDPLFVQLTPRELMKFSGVSKEEAEDPDGEEGKDGEEDGGATGDDAADTSGDSGDGSGEDELDHSWANEDGGGAGDATGNESDRDDAALKGEGEGNGG